jgi:hydroxyacylglutathione hydrolase
MFVHRFFEPGLAQTSYLIGCVETGEAIVVDPNRDIEPYLRAAKAEGARVTHVTETHIHADYVSGSRELAAKTGAHLYVSGEGGPEWSYAFASEPNVVVIKHGDRINVGNIRIDVVHTPGHTPEHVTFLVTDTAGATEPIAAVTGDFIFVGDVGRPDLLERAAHQTGTMEVGARALYRSLRAFADHPDWLQIWPGHGAGSSCGKGISAIPQSTLGYERRFNWAFQINSEAEFIKRVLDGQPDPPKYFATMKRVNRQGPKVIGHFPSPPHLDAATLPDRLAKRSVVVDIRRAVAFATGHVPGTINIPMNGSFATWAGWLMPYDADVFLLADEGDRGKLDVAAAVRAMSLIGLDRVAGWFDTSALDAWSAAGKPLGMIPQLGTGDLAQSLAHAGVTLVDVRSDAEWSAGHIAGARHLPLGRLTDRLAELPRSKPIVLQCQSGSRSAIAASLLRARGFDPVLNLTGGISAWVAEGREVETGSEVAG